MDKKWHEEEKQSGREKGVKDEGVEEREVGGTWRTRVKVRG